MVDEQNGYWKGKIDAKFEFNDKEHERLFDAITKFAESNEEEHKDINSKITTLRIKSSFFGFIGSAIAFIILWLSTRLLK